MMLNEATLAFVRAHRHDDVRRLALHPSRDGDVDMPRALDQIKGWQTACRKLPSWARVDGIVYPPHLNMEQCSSEATASYKRKVVERQFSPISSAFSSRQGGELIDLTGGFGVDFAFLSPLFRHAVYVERSEALCALARHNFQALQLRQSCVVCAEAEAFLHGLSAAPADGPRVVFLDPARRDLNGRRVFGLADCTPNVLEMKEQLLKKADFIVLKLSPMLDWHEAVKVFDGRCVEVDIVSVGNECKELLLVVWGDRRVAAGTEVPRLTLCLVNDGREFTLHPDGQSKPRLASGTAYRYLFVPNASVMKASVFAHFTEVFPLFMADRDAHLFLGDDAVPEFPGRRYTILGVTTLGKRELREKLAGIRQADISVRCFPLSAEALRRRLKLKEGGSLHLFATTVGGRHVIFITKREEGVSVKREE